MYGYYKYSHKYKVKVDGKYMRLSHDRVFIHIHPHRHSHMLRVNQRDLSSFFAVYIIFSILCNHRHAHRKAAPIILLPQKVKNKKNATGHKTQIYNQNRSGEYQGVYIRI